MTIQEIQFDRGFYPEPADVKLVGKLEGLYNSLTMRLQIEKVAQYFFPDGVNKMPENCPPAWQLYNFISQDGGDRDPYNLTSGILETYRYMAESPEEYDPAILQALRSCVLDIGLHLSHDWKNIPEQSRLLQSLSRLYQELPPDLIQQLSLKHKFFSEEASRQLTEQLETFFNRSDVREGMLQVLYRYRQHDALKLPPNMITLQDFERPMDSDGNPHNVASTVLVTAQYAHKNPGFCTPEEMKTLDAIVHELVDVVSAAPASELRHNILLKARSTKRMTSNVPLWEGSPAIKEMVVGICKSFDRHQEFIINASDPFEVDSEADPSTISKAQLCIDNMNYMLSKCQERGLAEIDPELMKPVKGIAAMVEGLRGLYLEPTVTQQDKLQIQEIFQEIRKTVEDVVKANKTGDAAELANEILALLPSQGRSRAKTDEKT